MKGRFVTPVVVRVLYDASTHRPFGDARVETRSTRTLFITIVDVEEGLNDIPVVFTVVRYISFLPTDRFDEVVPPMDTVQVQAD